MYTKKLPDTLKLNCKVLKMDLQSVKTVKPIY